MSRAILMLTMILLLGVSPGALAERPEALEKGARRTHTLEQSDGQVSPGALTRDCKPVAALHTDCSLFALAELLTGPSSRTRFMLSDLAFIGNFIKANDVRQARWFLQSAKIDIVSAFQYGLGGQIWDYEDTAQQFEWLEGSFWESPSGFRDQLVGLDLYLEFRETSARYHIDRYAVSPRDRMHWVNILKAVVKARRVIGVPPSMRNRSEADATIQRGDLKPGGSPIPSTTSEP